jgi:hypothetical protein
MESGLQEFVIENCEGAVSGARKIVLTKFGAAGPASLYNH